MDYREITLFSFTNGMTLDGIRQDLDDLALLIERNGYWDAKLELGTEGQYDEYDAVASIVAKRKETPEEREQRMEMELRRLAMGSGDKRTRQQMYQLLKQEFEAS